MELKYFKDFDFWRCNPPCKMSDCDENALRLLDRLRELYGKPIVLNCAYRSPQHDLEKGRSGSSFHCRGMAFDIRCTSSQDRFNLVNIASLLGFNGIGIYPTFVHIDTRNYACMFIGDTE